MKNEKALAIVKTLPNIHITKEIFLPLLYKGNEAYKSQGSKRLPC